MLFFPRASIALDSTAITREQTSAVGVSGFGFSGLGSSGLGSSGLGFSGSGLPGVGGTVFFETTKLPTQGAAVALPISSRAWVMALFAAGAVCCAHAQLAPAAHPATHLVSGGGNGSGGSHARENSLRSVQRNRISDR